MFGINLQNKPKNVPDTFEERLLILERDLRKAKGDIIGLNIDIDDMRNKVLRKIQSKRAKEEEENGNEWGGIPVQ